MSKRSKKGNQLMFGTIGLMLFIGAIVFLSDQTEFFRGQFYFNSQLPESQKAAQEIDTTLPTDLPSQVTVSKSTNSPAQIEKNSSLIAVFEIAPNPESQEIITPSRLVLNVASEKLTTSNIEAKVFFAHKPHCDEIEKSFCDFPPEPETTFVTTQIVQNPTQPNDSLIELTASNPWKLDPQDWRYEEYGNTYYLAVYSNVKTPENTDNNSLLTSVKYLGNSEAPFGITGLPTEYQITNIY